VVQVIARQQLVVSQPRLAFFKHRVEFRHFDPARAIRVVRANEQESALHFRDDGPIRFHGRLFANSIHQLTHVQRARFCALVGANNFCRVGHGFVRKEWRCVCGDGRGLRPSHCRGNEFARRARLRDLRERGVQINLPNNPQAIGKLRRDDDELFIGQE
jgi:hypothetical protein